MLEEKKIPFDESVGGRRALRAGILFAAHFVEIGSNPGATPQSDAILLAQLPDY
jgi:hypothetical protein